MNQWINPPGEGVAEINHIVMLASENDSLRGGKVGGVGDVIRDLPDALAKLGWRVTAVIPSYGFLHKNNPAKKIADVPFPFGGKQTSAEIFEVTPKVLTSGVTHLVVEHPLMRGEPIYFNDPPEQAFARDATKYAAFCSAVGQYLGTLPQPFVVHLHDWHTGAYFLLKELHPDFTHLKNYKSVFTIHNLAIQGNRPIRGKQASVETWFSELFTQTEWISDWKDPRYTEPVFTPMAVGIRFAAKVNTVSPTYAEEILRPSDHANGFYGGEGLEQFLLEAKGQNRLFGILNGTEYPSDRTIRRRSIGDILDVIAAEVTKWNARKPDALHDAVLQRVQKLRNVDPEIILTSVTRVTEQKVRLFFEKGTNGMTAMENILVALTAHNGVYLLLGTGTADYENRLAAAFRAYERLVYLKGYSDEIAEALYNNGTLFMMPSSFEPCGIGQMVAMRNGQPCVVHGTGGLKDTVHHLQNGFVFDGKTIRQQVDDFVRVTKEAVQLHRNDPERWRRIKAEALNVRFTWEKSAKQYIDLMYKSSR